MTSESKNTKADTAPKQDAPAKVDTTTAKAKEASKPEGGEAAAPAPSTYSRGEGQKPVTAAYKENWNVIFAKKKIEKTKKKKTKNKTKNKTKKRTTKKIEKNTKKKRR